MTRVKRNAYADNSVCVAPKVLQTDGQGSERRYPDERKAVGYRESSHLKMFWLSQQKCAPKIKGG